MVFCDTSQPGWLNQPAGTHANSCSPGSPPAYNDYGTNPHTDSCYNYNGYADDGGLPLCPGAYQGSFHVNNDCDNVVAFSNFSNHSDVPHGDYCDTYQNWTDTYQNWPNTTHANVSHLDSGGATCRSYSSSKYTTYPCSDTVCSGNGCFAQWWGQYFCNDSFCNSHPNYFCYVTGNGCFSNVAYSQRAFQNTTWPNHTDIAADPHADGCSSHANYAYTQWSNYQHTSHINFCNHSDAN